MIRALKAEAHHRGIAQMSLSVEPGNDAAHLYPDEGFTPVAGREQDGAMTWSS